MMRNKIKYWQECNYCMKRLKPTNKNLMNVPLVFRQRKRLYNFGYQSNLDSIVIFIPEKSNSYFKKIVCVFLNYILIKIKSELFVPGR